MKANAYLLKTKEGLRQNGGRSGVLSNHYE